MSALLETQALVSGRNAQPLHAPLDFTLGAGECVCLLGRNGAGKSTLLQTVLGRVPALAGAVRWAGENVQNVPSAQRAAHVALVPQRPIIPEGMTVEELLKLGAFRFQKQALQSAPKVQNVLERVGLAGFEHRLLSALSGGEQQRAMLGRALMQGAGTLVLDEPTAYLDPAQRAHTLSLIETICAEGTAVLFSSHHPEDATRIAQRVLAFLPGEIRVMDASAVDAATLRALYAA